MKDGHSDSEASSHSEGGLASLGDLLLSPLRLDDRLPLASVSPWQSLLAVPVQSLRSDKASSLRQLSWRAKELIENTGTVTYKVVADALVHELQLSSCEARDERNVRRRVYDVLNVLTAAKVITRRGKLVSSPYLPLAALTRRPGADQKRERLRKLLVTYSQLTSLFRRNATSPRQAECVPLPCWLLAVPANYSVSLT